MTQPIEWTQEELTKKLKAARKRIRLLESELDSGREARKELEGKILRLDLVQQNLMFNLRRVLQKMSMKPARPPA